MPIVDELKILVTAEVSKAIADLNKTQAATTKADSGFKTFAKSIAGYTTGMNVAVDVTKKILSGIGDLAKQSIVLASSFEKAETTWGVLMGDMSAGSAMFDDLMSFAARTPLAFESINKAATTLKGFGVEADDLIPTMEKLGDVSMGDNEALSQLALVFGQVKAQGKAMTQDLYQFVNAGIPIFQLLGETMGVSAGEVKELASQSKITFGEIDKALTAATKEGGQFYGMMNKVAETTAGKWSTAQDNFKQGLAELGNSVIPIVNAALDAYNRRVDEMAKQGGITKAFSGEGSAIEDVKNAIAVAQAGIDKFGKMTNSEAKETTAFYVAEKKRLEARLDFLEQIAAADKDVADRKRKQEEDAKKADEDKNKRDKDAIKNTEAMDEAYEDWGDEVIALYGISSLLNPVLDETKETVKDIGNEVDQVSSAWGDWTLQIGDSIVAVDEMKDAISSMWNMGMDTLDMYNDSVKDSNDAEISGLEKRRDQMEENGQSTVEIDKMILAKKNEYGKQQFEAEKLTKLAEIAINTAVEASKVLAIPGAPLLIGILGGVQAGIVGSQQYVPYATGGYVDQPTHALVGEAGGEWILNKAQMAGLAQNGIGGGGTTIVQNIAGSVWNTKQLQSMAVSAQAKASRGF